MAQQGRWQDEDRYRRDREARFDDQYANARRERELLMRGEGGYRGDREAFDYGRDYGAPYRGRGYERDEDEGRSGEAWGAAGYNAVNSYGTNYGGRFDRGGYRRDTGWTGAGRFDRGDEYDRTGRFGRDDGRNWWDRATDEVSSWFGDREAERRRVADQERTDLRGRGPKGYTRSDERIREEVCDRLSDDPFVDASEIEVAVSGGEVTLSGTAGNREERRRAEDCAERVSGVTHVQNNVRVNQGSFANRNTPAGQGSSASGNSGHAVTTSSSVASGRSPTGIGSGSDPYSRGTTGSGATGGNPALGGGEGGTGIR